ncbi:polysaccharide pyruvyl transferase family protein [Streptomyces sp. NPDC050560]|uniref:polysaccharide pyruvyl transferase family protein n=1 Tax=Streptomyces sp. NPDC050560 TaxID=3365630 RepID=UPI0037A72C97
MKRILMRSGKSPFDVVTHEEYIHRDLLGTNTGNLLFSDSVHKLLTLPGTEVVSNGIRTDTSAERAARINEEYDAFVIPLANAFRTDWKKSLDRLSALVEQLTIPVVVIGVGAQVGEDYATETLRPIEESVKRFVRAVLERSATIGVRGELTASYLKGLGFDAVDIIGCPSMFLHGDTFPAPREPGDFGPGSRIALNLSPDALPVGDVAGLARHAHERFPHLMYYAQNLVDAELLFWGDTSEAEGRHDPFPLQMTHPLFAEDKVRVPVDPATWLAELAGYDFAYGTRIHGNIAALLAGTPAVMLAHDSRTLELCRYFGIPYRLLSETPADIPPEKLYEQADYRELTGGHRERFARMVAFLDRNGLRNTYTHGDRGAAFDARVAALDLPPSIGAWDGSDDGAMRYRISRLRARIAANAEKTAAANRKITGLTKRLTDAEKKNTALTARLTSLEKQLAAVTDRVTKTEKRVTGIDKRVMVRLGPALRRRLRRG